MRTGVTGMVLLAAAAATAAQGEVRVVDAAQAKLQSAPLLIASADPAPRYDSRPHLHFGRVALIRTVAGGVDASPFVTALPGEMWHGRLRSFGEADGIGFSGIAVRARSIGFSGFQSERHVSGFLASELRYGIALNKDDLLTVDLNGASQRIAAFPMLGRGKSVRVGSMYFGMTFAHARRFSATGGWYRVSVSSLSPLDYAIERTAGMPAAGRGMRLGLDWCLSGQDAPSAARVGLELRDGDADRDRRLALSPGAGRDQRLLLRFTAPF